MYKYSTSVRSRSTAFGYALNRLYEQLLHIQLTSCSRPFSCVEKAPSPHNYHPAYVKDECRNFSDQATSGCASRKPRSLFASTAFGALRITIVHPYPKELTSPVVRSEWSSGI